MSKYPSSINQALYASTRSANRTRSTCADYARYEAHKSEWRSCNPGATPQQYEAAVRAIAKQCGV
jgi:hypothetical protein